MPSSSFRRRLGSLWRAWQRFGKAMGVVVSTIFLTVFYFTFFALFAIPYRISLWLRSRNGRKTWYRTSVHVRKGINAFTAEY